MVVFEKKKFSGDQIGWSEGEKDSNYQMSTDYFYWTWWDIWKDVEKTTSFWRSWGGYEGILIIILS